MGNVEGGSPVSADLVVGTCGEASPDRFVQVGLLLLGHHQVAGEGPQQPDVGVGVVAQLPVEVANAHAVEEAACLQLMRELRQLAGPRPRGIGRQLLTVLVVELPEHRGEVVHLVVLRSGAISPGRAG